MGVIKVNGIKCYAYHGCLKEESVIGGNYIVNVVIDADLTTAAKTDELKDTVDYVKINKIVQDQMSIRSKLIETVAQRILDAIKGTYEEAKIRVEVVKVNPPMHGQVENVSVELDG